MDRLLAMKVFVEVVDRGTMSTAADALDMSRSMVSRYITELEEWIGARLLHRTTRRISLTTAGETAVTRCREVLELTGSLRSTLIDDSAAPSGHIRVTCSPSLGQSFLAAAVAEFVGRHPQTEVDMLMADHTVNLIEEQVDLAIRISHKIDPGLVARKLGVCRSVLCATPAYLNRQGVPQQPDDLSRHQCLLHRFVGKRQWRLTCASQTFSVAVNGRICANEASVLMSAVLADAGIAMLPMYLASPLLTSGNLINVLPDYQPDAMGIFGVYASRKQMPAAVRSFLTFLGERFSVDPQWTGLTTSV